LSQTIFEAVNVELCERKSQQIDCSAPAGSQREREEKKKKGEKKKSAGLSGAVQRTHGIPRVVCSWARRWLLI